MRACCTTCCHLQAQMVDDTTCAANPVHQGPTYTPTFTPTNSEAVKYSDLAAAGWGVLPTRPRSDNADALSTLFDTPDFWSLVCNSFDKMVSRTSCGELKQGPLGVVHIRYDCGSGTTGTFWILT